MPHLLKRRLKKKLKFSSRLKKRLRRRLNNLSLRKLWLKQNSPKRHIRRQNKKLKSKLKL